MTWLYDNNHFTDIHNIIASNNKIFHNLFAGTHPTNKFVIETNKQIQIFKLMHSNR